MADMELFKAKISDIKPYPNNPRLNDEAVEAVAESIKQCGYVAPIIVDEDMVVLAGHTRLKALKKLRRKECEIIVRTGLTDEQKAKYRILDNKTSEFADWDMEMLELELTGLDFDGFDFGFPEFEEADEEPDGYYGDERERTYNSMNLHDVDLERTAGRWQMPIIKATQHIPKDLISFNYMLNKDAFDKGIHFYIDDYQFERIWNQPYQYMDRLRQFDCALTPDFSMYLEMPLAMQLWNVYRSRMVGQLMQDFGVTVIPTLMWSTEDSFDFCFDGIEPGGVVSVSTIGVKKDKESRKYFDMGMDEAIRRLRPSHIVVYGGDIGYKFDCPVTYIKNHNSEEFANRQGDDV
jgi:hypothetical protein